jgi:type II secretion system protein C
MRRQEQLYDKALEFLLSEGKWLFLAIFAGILLANILSSLLGGALMSFIDPLRGTPSANYSSTGYVASSDINLRDLRKQILERNLFNSTGEYPDEPDPSDQQSDNVAVFDSDGPCSQTNLNLNLVGVIYLGPTGTSVASIREKGIDIADLYKEGMTIIDNEDASIFKIEEDRVVLNNAGRKECLDLSSPVSLARSEDTTQSPVKQPQAVAVGGVVTLKENYVKEQLGTSLELALDRGRLVPVTEGGQVLGFKLISLDPNSLFAKIGLKEGDVITQVNDISLRQPDQGFAFYQVFQDERDIRIGVLREENPVSVNVSIVD